MAEGRTEWLGFMAVQPADGRSRYTLRAGETALGVRGLAVYSGSAVATPAGCPAVTGWRSGQRVVAGSNPILYFCTV